MIFEFSIHEYISRMLMAIVALVLVAALVRNYFHLRAETAFNLLGFNVVIFNLAYFLAELDIAIGFALGLFALFSMIRFRTQALDSVNMTLLVMSAGFALLASLADVPILALPVIFIIMIVIVYLVERLFMSRCYEWKTVTLDGMMRLDADSQREVAKIIGEQLGVSVIGIKVLAIDLKQKTTKADICFKR